MKISVKGGGGLAGSLERYELDTTRLPQGEAIEALLRNLDFFDAPAPPQPVGADIPRWEITADDGLRCHTIAFADDGSAACARWKSLVEHLRGT